MRALAALAAAFAALALAAGPAAAQAARPSQVTAVYNVHARGMEAGRFNLGVTLNGAAYEATAERRMTGLARTLLGESQDYRYSARGQVTAAGEVRPSAYQHQGGRRNRLVRVAFGADDVVTTAEPAMGMGDPPATRAQKLGSIDQVSMFLAMMVKPGEPCRGTLRVLLDGRGRADFVMSPNGQERVSIAGFSGQAQRCRVQYRPIAGFSEPQEAADLSFLLAPIGGVNAPLRIEMPSDDAGVIRLQARSFAVR
jgi:hypothetical protein